MPRVLLSPGRAARASALSPALEEPVAASASAAAAAIAAAPAIVASVPSTPPPKSAAAVAAGASGAASFASSRPRVAAMSARSLTTAVLISDDEEEAFSFDSDNSCARPTASRSRHKGSSSSSSAVASSLSRYPPRWCVDCEEMLAHATYYKNHYGGRCPKARARQAARKAEPTAATNGDDFSQSAAAAVTPAAAAVKLAATASSSPAASASSSGAATVVAPSDADVDMQDSDPENDDGASNKSDSASDSEFPAESDQLMEEALKIIFAARMRPELLQPPRSSALSAAATTADDPPLPGTKQRQESVDSAASATGALKELDLSRAALASSPPPACLSPPPAGLDGSALGNPNVRRGPANGGPCKPLIPASPTNVIFPSPNARWYGESPFRWENCVDDLTPLGSFLLIDHSVLHPSVTRVMAPVAAEPEAFMIGCNCPEGKCDPKSCECATGARNQYTRSGCIKNNHERQEFQECWVRCSCACNEQRRPASPSTAAPRGRSRPPGSSNNRAGGAGILKPCFNRVVGRSSPSNPSLRLVVFRTPDGRGWGLRTLDRIPGFTFVCDYLGERIHEYVTEARGQAYAARKEMNFIFTPNSRLPQMKYNKIRRRTGERERKEGKAVARRMAKKEKHRQRHKKQKGANGAAAAATSLSSDEEDDSDGDNSRDDEDDTSSTASSCSTPSSPLSMSASSSYSSSNSDSSSSSEVDYTLDHSIEPFSLDAAHMGSVARFANHSCAPNMLAVEVLVEYRDPRLPRVALFTKSQGVLPGGELTFSYGESHDRVQGKFECKCAECKKKAQEKEAAEIAVWEKAAMTPSGITPRTPMSDTQRKLVQVAPAKSSPSVSLGTAAAAVVPSAATAASSAVVDKSSQLLLPSLPLPNARRSLSERMERIDQPPPRAGGAPLPLHVTTSSSGNSAAAGPTAVVTASVSSSSVAKFSSTLAMPGAASASAMSAVPAASSAPAGKPADERASVSLDARAAASSPHVVLDLASSDEEDEDKTGSVRFVVRLASAQPMETEEAAEESKDNDDEDDEDDGPPPPLVPVFAVEGRMERQGSAAGGAAAPSPATAPREPAAAPLAVSDGAHLRRLVQLQEDYARVPRLPSSRVTFAGDAASCALVNDFNYQVETHQVVSLLLTLLYPDSNLGVIRKRLDALQPILPLLVQQSPSATVCGALLLRFLRRKDLTATDLPVRKAEHIERLRKLLLVLSSDLRSMTEKPRPKPNALAWWTARPDWLYSALQAASAMECGDRTCVSGAVHPQLVLPQPPAALTRQEQLERAESADPMEESKEDDAVASNAPTTELPQSPRQQRTTSLVKVHPVSPHKPAEREVIEIE